MNLPNTTCKSRKEANLKKAVIDTLLLGWNKKELPRTIRVVTEVYGGKGVYFQNFLNPDNDLKERQSNKTGTVVRGHGMRIKDSKILDTIIDHLKTEK